MRLRPSIIGSQSYRQMFLYTGGPGRFVSLASSAPGTPGTVVERVNQCAGGSDNSVCGGTGAVTAVGYNLFYKPINPGDVAFAYFRVGARLDICPSAIANTTGKIFYFLMTSPASWDPTTITYATRPTIDLTDLNIEWDAALNTGAAIGGSVPQLVSGVSLRVDLSAITKPIVGVGSFAQLTAGYSVVGNQDLQTNPAHFTFYTLKSAPTFAVSARSATGTSRTLYVSGDVTFWVPGMSLTVNGVGAGYDVGNVFATGAVQGVITAIDAVAGTITYTYPGTLTEAMVASSGTVYYGY